METKKSKNTNSFNLLKSLWPDLKDRASARKEARSAAIAAWLVAGISTLFALLPFLGVDTGVNLWAIIDAVLFIAIGYEIYKMSRVAAIAGLVLFIIEKLMAPPTGYSWLLAIALISAFITGVRATFAYPGLSDEKSKAAASSGLRIMPKLSKRVIILLFALAFLLTIAAVVADNAAKSDNRGQNPFTNLTNPGNQQNFTNQATIPPQKTKPLNSFSEVRTFSTGKAGVPSPETARVGKLSLLYTPDYKQWSMDMMSKTNPKKKDQYAQTLYDLPSTNIMMKNNGEFKIKSVTYFKSVPSEFSYDHSLPPSEIDPDTFITQARERIGATGDVPGEIVAAKYDYSPFVDNKGQWTIVITLKGEEKNDVKKARKVVFEDETFKEMSETELTITQNPNSFLRAVNYR